MYGDSRVLLCDASVVSRDSLTAILTECGFRVIGHVTNTDDAVERCRLQQPEVVLIDVGLRGTVDPLVTLRHLRRMCPTTVFFATGALSQSRLMMDALSAGARDFLTRPFHRQSVRQTLRLNLG